MAIRRFIVSIVLLLVAACSPSGKGGNGQPSPRAGAVGQAPQALECDCSIGLTCYEEGDIDPSNTCNVCRSASAADAWSRIDAPACAAGLTGEYFASGDLSGTSAFTRVDSELLLDTYGSPGAPIGDDVDFSVRWTGQIVAPITDEYWFIFEGDEGGRVWVDGKLLADTWGASSDRGKIHLDATVRYDIKVESFDTTDRAFVRLVWHTDSGNVWWQGVPSQYLFADAAVCSGCDDSNPCTNERCTTTDQCAHPAADEGLACTGGFCQRGACCTGCDDGDPCTRDACLQGGGCGHTNAADGTTCVGGTCQSGSCCSAGDLSCLTGSYSA